MRHLLTGFGVSVLVASVPAAGIAQDKVFDSNGVQIRYVEQGTGEHVALVHGQTVNIERSWVGTGILADLARDHCVVAFDLRGHGKSGKPHEPSAGGVCQVVEKWRLPSL
jgi:pimeloyl-ACP methyl ester carboxylesterase